MGEAQRANIHGRLNCGSLPALEGKGVKLFEAESELGGQLGIGAAVLLVAKWP